MEKRQGVCNLCEAICGLEFTLEGGDIVSVRGNPEDPLSRGHICPKAVALQDIWKDPDRLRRPVRRTDSGWEEMDWDEAFDLVAERLSTTINTHGGGALGIYLGNPTVHSLGALTHGTQLARMLRTRNTFSATSVDQLPQQLVSYLLYGHQLAITVPDIDRTQYFLVFGGNPMASNGSLMTVPDFPNRLRELKARGGKLILFDPRRTETARVATEHHFIRPGGDALVLLAILQILFSEGLTTPLEYADGLAAVEAAVAPFSPERAAAYSGVAADEIRRIAREFAASDAAVCYGRVGVSTQQFGTVCQWAIQMINIVTSNLDRPGGSMFTSPAVDVVGRRFVGRGGFNRWQSRVRKLPEFGGELPVSTLADEILTPGEGQVRAAITNAGNPVLSTPNGARLAEALDTLDFMVSVDFYINETTSHADVILPPTSALERDHYDLIFHVFAVRNTARYTPALFPRPEGALDDWEIFREVGTRTSALITDETLAAKRAEVAKSMQLTPTQVVDALLSTGKHGLSVRQLKKSGSGVDLGPLESVLPGRLMTEGQRINAAQDVVLADLARLDEVTSKPVDPTELQLIGRRHQRDNNSWMHNTARLTKGKARHQLLMHPDDLASRGLADGESVKVSSRVGSVDVEVSASEDMMPGVVSLPHGYGHQRDGVRMANAQTMPGVSINDLTDPDRLDEASGNAVLSGVPVQVRALAAASGPEYSV